MAVHKAPGPVLPHLGNKAKYRSRVEKHQNIKPLMRVFHHNNLCKWQNVPVVSTEVENSHVEYEKLKIKIKSYFVFLYSFNTKKRITENQMIRMRIK